MTTTYRPDDPAYLDESDLRVEMERVFDLCQGCRLCFNLCPSFPTLFDFVDAHDGDVGAMSPAEQDTVVDECYQCKLCYPKCPYVPPHEWQLDFPRLMMRAHAVRHDGGQPVAERITDQVLGRTDLLGRVSTAAAPLVNALTGTPGSLTRRVMERTAGMASERLLPPYARTRFSTWFRRRSARIDPRAFVAGAPQGEVTVFPTCFIEYMEPAIGQDLVKVYERNGVACSMPEGARCCGAPWLHQGNIKEFTKSARANVTALAREVRAGKDVVVAQPTCAYVVRKDYPIYLAGTSLAADAVLVAEHTADPAEYLVALHKAEGTSLDTEFPGRDAGAVPDEVTYHVACHLQAQHIGLKSRDLLKVAGVQATLVQRCSGIDGTWGYRSENYELARRVAAPMAKEIRAAGNDVVCGDCHLANGAIEQETGARPVHPIQLMARAYGIPEERR
jgi:glycerol-3-phosphate dehydrogenase subunit C